MSLNRPINYYAGLVHELCSQPTETEWVEFKHNNDDPQEIGEYISALSNAAALAGKAVSHIVWGIEDGTHKIIGTKFDPQKARVGNEQLENWLNHLIEPHLHFAFIKVKVCGSDVVLLEISAAHTQPTRFKGEEYIRVGSYKKKLREHPEKERALWRVFDQKHFEDHIAVENVNGDDVLRLLDYPAYFDLLKLPLPEARAGILESFESDRLIRRSAAGQWDITNLGAVLLAKQLTDFGSLGRKVIRVIQYKGNSRIETIREQEGTKGYANGFEGLISYINGLLPSNEIIGKALRKTVPMYPELAVRELVANALIHQDFSITGAGPMVEIFEDRMEISNPGEPLIDPERFLDTPPRSRNEQLASLMRRFGICEERGSGVDKVVHVIEYYQLPAPMFEVAGDTTRVVLYAQRPLSRMDKDDRVRACYQHACLKYVMREFMTNSTLRQRFGIEDRNIAQASRLIKEAVEAGAIYPYDVNAAPRMMKYIPWWAHDQAT